MTGLLDINTRFGYDPHTGRTFTPEAIKAAGAKWGVVAAYTYSLNALLFDVVAGNQETWEVCQADPYFRPVAVLSPFRADRDNTPAAVKARGFAFARLFPEQHSYALDGFAARDLLAACGAASLPVMVSVLAAPPPMLARVMAETPCPVILTGLRYHTLGEVLALGGHLSNLYLDACGVSTPGGIALLAEAFGTERLLFGSDYPALYVGCAAMLLRTSGLSEEVQARIAHGNARRLLGVEK